MFARLGQREITPNQVLRPGGVGTRGPARRRFLTAAISAGVWALWGPLHGGANVAVMPVSIYAAGREYSEGVDIGPEEFITFLETLKEMGTLKEVLEARDPSDLYRSVRFPDQE